MEPFEDLGFMFRPELNPFLAALAGEGEDAFHGDTPLFHVVKVVEQLGPGGVGEFRGVFDLTDDGLLDPIDADEAVNGKVTVAAATVSVLVKEATQGDEVRGMFHGDLPGEPPEFSRAHVKVVNLRPLRLESLKHPRRHANISSNSKDQSIITV